ncbi:hypothetical protein AVEN_255787-1 [Araneus ventricosus]|uniref:RNase H type-1 domain-containing protein n=1 Tax=Araneus ventricosus TaxID=182803 RepID=A0A4Y2QCC7_ARAVE|nr:hypothetical protein AVEN_255787-1 [Araneus ventricosus]
MDYKTGSAFLIKKEDTMKYEWMSKLRPLNTVFQAELLAIGEAYLWATKSNQHVKIRSAESRASIQSLQLTQRALLRKEQKKFY